MAVIRVTILCPVYSVSHQTEEGDRDRERQRQRDRQRQKTRDREGERLADRQANIFLSKRKKEKKKKTNKKTRETVLVEDEFTSIEARVMMDAAFPRQHRTHLNDFYPKTNPSKFTPAPSRPLSSMLPTLVLVASSALRNAVYQLIEGFVSLHACT